jgi:hypothetical protein
VQRPRKDLMAQFRLDMVVHVGVIVDAACWVMPPSWDSRPQVGTNFDFLALPQVSRNLPSSPTCYRPALHTASAALSDKKMVAVKLQDTRRFLLPASPVLYAANPKSTCVLARETFPSINKRGWTNASKCKLRLFHMTLAGIYHTSALPCQSNA